MQDEQAAVPENTEQTTPTNTQQLIDYLGAVWQQPYGLFSETWERAAQLTSSLLIDSQQAWQQPHEPPSETLERVVQLITSLFTDSPEADWQRPYEPSSEILKRVTQLVSSLPQPYQVAGLNAIAAHLVSGMSLHYLELMATFQEKAEQEGIDQEEREGTFEDILSDWFHRMMQLSKHISVQSVDDLVDLSKITIGWYRPSLVNTAEDAQRWMYRLPRVYYGRLEQENLITDAQSQLEETAPSTSTQIANPPVEEHPFTLWRSRSPKAIPASVEHDQDALDAA